MVELAIHEGLRNLCRKDWGLESLSGHFNNMHINWYLNNRLQNKIHLSLTVITWRIHKAHQREVNPLVKIDYTFIDSPLKEKWEYLLNEVK